MADVSTEENDNTNFHAIGPNKDKPECRIIVHNIAKENNIEVVTVPNLKEKFFYTIDLPTFNNAIEKAREENVVMNKVINSYLSNLVPEPEPTEEPFDVLW